MPNYIVRLSMRRRVDRRVAVHQIIMKADSASSLRVGIEVMKDAIWQATKQYITGYKIIGITENPAHVFVPREDDDESE